MGKHPVTPRPTLGKEGNVFIVKHVAKVALRVSLFDKTSGRSEDCDLAFSVSARHEFGAGVVFVHSELNREQHAQLIIHVLKTLRK